MGIFRDKPIKTKLGVVMGVLQWCHFLEIISGAMGKHNKGKLGGGISQTT